MSTNKIVSEIRKTNPERNSSTMQRRLIKILEELGEASEAYLSRTSDTNYKKKTWEDYREESVDILIVLLDVGLTMYPKGSYPAGAMLELNIEEGKEKAPNDFSEMEHLKFDVARAVCSAQYYLHTPDSESGFVGAIGRGVRAAASMCYTKVPGQSHGDIEESVFALVTKKLDKWKSGSSTAQPLTTPQNEVLVQSEFFEQFGDRNQ